MKTINHEYYVSLEVAKLLKETGFDWECRGYYDRRILRFNFVWGHNGKGASTQCSAPTLDVAQRWLREVKEIEVNTLCVYINNVKKYCYSVFEGKYNNERIEEGFDTFEEAQEAGIKKVVEIILEKGK